MSIIYSDISPIILIHNSTSYPTTQLTLEASGRILCSHVFPLFNRHDQRTNPQKNMSNRPIHGTKHLHAVLTWRMVRFYKAWTSLDCFCFGARGVLFFWVTLKSVPILPKWWTCKISAKHSVISDNFPRTNSNHTFSDAAWIQISSGTALVVKLHTAAW